MIAVIADDFTGAAELAGIALRYGLSAELCLDRPVYQGADVLVVCTDSRSLPLPDALEVTKEVLRELKQFSPEWIYKKTDSALRGYIVEELQLQQQKMRKERVLLMPANPSLGRTIRKGTYFIGEEPIDATSFAHDPEFPIRSAKVREQLGPEVQVLTPGADLPATGIVVGEARSAADYTHWARNADDSWLLAGAGDFFIALLERTRTCQPFRSAEMCSPHLYVCGTAFDERKEFIRALDQHGLVAYLPHRPDEEWLRRAGTILQQQQRLVIAIDASEESAADLRSRMAMTVQALTERYAIRELFIEGGSTAAAVLHELGIRQLQPTDELSRGVVRMKAGEIFITVKPGSYPLPEPIQRLYKPAE